MRHAALAALLLACQCACAAQPGAGVTVAAAAAVHAAAATPAPADASYLSLEWRPDQATQQLVDGLLAPLGFVDPAHMLPQRDASLLHATVAYFHQALTSAQDQALRKRFAGRQATLSLTGVGFAHPEGSPSNYEQVAYLVVKGIEPARQQLATWHLAADEDDPHVTIGANPANPRDVHGVPKLARRPVGPLAVQATYRYYHADAAGVMALSW